MSLSLTAFTSVFAFLLMNWMVTWVSSVWKSCLSSVSNLFHMLTGTCILTLLARHTPRKVHGRKPLQRLAAEG